MLTKKILTDKDFFVRKGETVTMFYRDGVYIAHRDNNGPIEFLKDKSPRYRAEISMYRLHSKQYDRLERIVRVGFDKRASELFWDYTCAVKDDDGLIDYHELWIYNSMLLK
jgi:hypothetical protein